MRLAEPTWLILLALMPLPWLLARARARISWPTFDGFGKRRRVWTRCKAALPFLLRAGAIVCAVVALARPQSIGGRIRIAGQGVAIVVALDQSSSMTTQDFPDGPGRPNLTRLEAAKNTLERFIAGRPDDVLGLVVFANYPEFACRLTLDHGFLLDIVRTISPAQPGDDGTNLGDAMVWALNDLKDAAPRKKVLILLTDGRNAPAVPHPADPSKAAAMARALGVTVHTIAVGTGGTVMQPIDPITKLGPVADVEGPDHELLAKLAELGGGKPFFATNAQALDDVFTEIDALEKSPVRGEVRTRYREEFVPWAVWALGLVLFDRLLAAGWLRRLP